MKIGLYRNYSCRRREQDEYRIRKWATLNNYEVVQHPDDADLIIYTTCAYNKDVTDLLHTEMQLLLPYNDKAIITGCLPDICEEYKIGNYNYKPRSQIFNYINTLEAEHDIMSITDADVDNCDCVHISKGCNRDCYFCSIKHSAGCLSSVEPDVILTNCQAKWSADKTPFLLGDETGCYGHDIWTNIVSLLNLLYANRVNESDKIILDNMEPGWFMEYYEDISQYMENGFINRIALGVQSFSKRLLTDMGRMVDYDVNQLADRIFDQANKRMAVTGQTYSNQLDIQLLVGYPTETDEDVILTLNQVVNYSIIPYSVSRFFRGCFSHAPLPDLAESVIDQRMQQLYAPINFGVDWLDAETNRKIYDIGLDKGLLLQDVIS